MRLFQAIVEGRVEGDEARVAASLLTATVPGLATVSVDDVLKTAKRISTEPSLQAAMDQILATSEEHGTGEITVDLR